MNINKNKDLEKRVAALEDQIKYVEMNQGLGNTIIDLQSQITSIKTRLHI